MRRRTTRHGRTGEPRLDRQVGWSELAVVGGMVLLIPVVLWTITDPLLAAGIAVFVGGMCVLARIGVRLIRKSAGGETDETHETGETGGTSGRAAD